MSQRVFVYGTLLRGQYNHSRLEQDTTKLLGGHRTDERYTMYSLGGFPAVVCDGGSSIKGEVYEVEESTLYGPLDSLEGYPSFYNRMLIPTEYGDAWIYYMEPVDKILPVINNGDWLQYKEN